MLLRRLYYTKYWYVNRRQDFWACICSLWDKSSYTRPILSPSGFDKWMLTWAETLMTSEEAGIENSAILICFCQNYRLNLIIHTRWKCKHTLSWDWLQNGNNKLNTSLLDELCHTYELFVLSYLQILRYIIISKFVEFIVNIFAVQVIWFDCRVYWSSYEL